MTPGSIGAPLALLGEPLCCQPPNGFLQPLRGKTYCSPFDLISTKSDSDVWQGGSHTVGYSRCREEVQ